MLRKYKIFLISLLFTNTAIGADMVNINFKEFKLDNGLRLIVHEDHKAPIVAVNLWYQPLDQKMKLKEKQVLHTYSNISCSTAVRITMMSF